MLRTLLPLAATLTLIAACSGDDETTSPSRTEPAVLLATTPGAESLYIAVGDSVSAAPAASDPTTTGWVALTASGLDLPFLNLGVSGYKGSDIIARELQPAITEITSRKSDMLAGNEVKLVTLQFGGNDAFGALLEHNCLTLAAVHAAGECATLATEAVAQYRADLKTITDALRAADETMQIVMLTLYNFGEAGETLPEDMGDYILEGLPGTDIPEGINDLMRAQAEASSADLVDVYELFKGHNRELIPLGDTHPNDAGNKVIANGVLTALGQPTVSP